MPNKKNIEQVANLKNVFSRAKAVYFTEYHGLDVEKITELRRSFFNEKVEYKVAKNTLLKIAINENSIDCIEGVFSGSTAIAVSYDEPSSPAKIIKNFNKKHDLPKVKGVFFDGEFFPASEFDRIANLPNKDELLSKLLATLNSPMQKFLSTVSSPLGKLVSVLESVKQKKV
ncbi:MAG: 50S ribosomal protein L10 [Candidatus Marinimicrobia bacterium]|nr:50S ribosomal protein L10 [Candidatus Neomarinimicrobiota bacterium]|tara:strand:+ start:2128 stop:2643 length:516 start_codon:yes stop_codon:yes gene_type:complete